MTLTSTYTDTITITVTYTGTETLTATHTQTNTASATITNTITYTQTATITMTPQLFPYALNISVYNEAGELVKVITNTASAENEQDMELLMNGSQTSMVLPGSGNALTIMMPGIVTPGQLKNGYADFTWDGTNSAGQDVANGEYYIKATTTDPFGHTTTIIKQVTALDQAQYAQINIFNSAGELVQTIKGPYDGTSQAELNLSNGTNNNNVFAVGNGSPPITINYTATSYLTWNGQSAQGNYIQSGVYEIQLVITTGAGYATRISKTITILNAGTADLMGVVKSLPNPYTGNGTIPLKFTWQPITTGTIEIKIYDMAGELVRILTGDLAAGTINWDLKSAGGQKVSSGTYICVVEGVDNTGNKKIKIVKIAAIISAGND
jgi:flagellar hook assembly protein FlgD